MDDPYWILFQNSLFSQLVFGPEKRFAFEVMQAFGGYDVLQMMLVAVAGAMGAFAFTYGVGRALAGLLRQAVGGPLPRLLDAAERKGRYYLYAAFLFSYSPLAGPVLPLFAGVLRLNVALVAGISMLSLGGFYLVRLLS